jgi:hypothetical protein
MFFRADISTSTDARLRALAKRAGHKIAAVFKDTASGADQDRA